MAIVFDCGCGQKLSCPDQFAGRQMKCPKCGTVLTAPSSPQAAPPAAPAAASPAPRNAPPQGPDAKVTCPFCAALISADAQKCQFCGQWIRPPAQGQAPPPQYQQPPPSQYGPPPAYYPPQQQVSPKSQSTTMLLGIIPMFCGIHGLDSFYLGKTGAGIGKLLTCGGFGIWTLIDNVFTGLGKRTDCNGLQLSRPAPVGTPVKSQAVAYLLAQFAGVFGLDRFYLGKIGTGILKLITCGGLGIWSMIDVVIVGGGGAKDSDGNSLVFP
jgi:TM2 domain-containing membrane protein YozV